MHGQHIPKTLSFERLETRQMLSACVAIRFRCKPAAGALAAEVLRDINLHGHAVLGSRPAAGQIDHAKAGSQRIDPANFVTTIDNPFFPLKPGTTFFYEGMKDGVPTSTEVFVTHDTKVILAVTTSVVHDRAFEDGVLAEDTIDWFAQDKAGNVWYFGEDTKELDINGNVISTEGSFEGGVNGALPGIVMKAHPRVGNQYLQEVAHGVAEDRAAVLSRDKEKCVRTSCFEDLLLTTERSRLDPGVVEHKFYARGVGFILSVIVKGGDERTELVRITTENG